MFGCWRTNQYDAFIATTFVCLSNSGPKFPLASVFLRLRFSKRVVWVVAMVGYIFHHYCFNFFISLRNLGKLNVCTIYTYTCWRVVYNLVFSRKCQYLSSKDEEIKMYHNWWTWKCWNFLEHQSSSLIFRVILVAQYLVFTIVFCQLLFVFLCIFFWPSYCGSFFELRLLTTLLVSSNCSYSGRIEWKWVALILGSPI